MSENGQETDKLGPTIIVILNVINFNNIRITNTRISKIFKLGSGNILQNNLIANFS